MKRYFASIVLAFGLVACVPPSANTPKPVISIQDKVGQDLYAAQTAIEQAKLDIAKFPQFKDALNKVIASYNTAEDAYVAYLATKKGDIGAIQTQVSALMTDVANLQKSGIGVKK